MTIAPPETVGLRLYRCRERLGLSVVAIATQLGTAPQVYYRWETDQQLPHLRFALRLAALFGETVENLFGE